MTSKFMLIILGCCCCCLVLVRSSAGMAVAEDDEGEGEPGASKLFFTEVPPEDLVLEADSGLELQCEAGGSPRPSVYWLHNGRHVNDQDDMSDRSESSGLQLGATRGRLHKGCLTASDSGTYTCVAEAGDRTISSTTTVIIASKANIIMWSTQLLEFQHNDVQLYCRAEGTPKPQISWMTSSGDSVQNDGKFELLANGDLIIHNLEWSDMGVYQCLATNILGSDQAEAFVYPTTDD